MAACPISELDLGGDAVIGDRGNTRLLVLSLGGRGRSGRPEDARWMARVILFSLDFGKFFLADLNYGTRIRWRTAIQPPCGRSYPVREGHRVT